MAEEEEKHQQQLQFKSSSSLQLHHQRPSISLPPRTSADSFFLNGPGFSPGPMTLVSSFFSESDPDSECRSFSQLLAGAISSPSANKEEDDGNGNGMNFRCKDDRPPGLNIGQQGQSNNITTTSSSSMFTVPAGLSPATLLDSPGFFSSLQGQFGMGHRQILAQVSAQTVQGQQQMQIGSEYPTSSSVPLASSQNQASAFTSNSTMHEQLPSIVSGPRITSRETPDYSQFDERSNYSSITVDKPVEDGYNWRKYGQKHVKGSEYPRSYYKCTHPHCPVKKKVERSLDGQVTEIIYKGEHNHQPPQSNKRGKDAGKSSGNSNVHGNHDFASQFVSGSSNKVHERPVTDLYKNERDSSQATEEQLSSDEEELDAGTTANERYEDEPDQKRRITDVRVPEPPPSHRTVTEPRIIVQTTSEVDLLDDGYRWRKYGQKVVKGNPYPRSYYKCTTPGCGVRKHVERAATDPKAVITTYEGKHNHDVPPSKNSSHNTANSNQLQIKSQGLGAAKHFQMNNSDFSNNRQQSAAVLRLKEEQIT